MNDSERNADQKSRGEKYADEKSRVIMYRANGKAPELRTVGSITIVCPELDTPLFLQGRKITLVIQEAPDGELREAFIVLSRPQREKLHWYLILMLIGATLMRLWYFFHHSY